jgi:hypothetical protein
MYECSPLPLGVCASTTTNHSISLNSQGCPKDHECSLKKLLNWVYSGAYGDLFYCMPKVEFENPLKCRSRQVHKDLVQGLSPQECTSVEDCTLYDGSFVPCQCGLSGISYCKPHFSSHTFDFYWDVCADRERPPADDLVYAFYLSMTYAESIHPPECAYKLFRDLAFIQAYQEDDDSSLALIAAALLWLY